MGKSNLVEMDFRQRVGMAFSAPGIAIDLRHQFPDTVQAVANHLRRIASRSGNQFIANYQHAVVASRDISLNQNFATDLRRHSVCSLNLCTAGKIHAHSPALVAITRLHNYRPAYLASGGPRVRRICHRSAC